MVESELYSTIELYDKMIENNNHVGYCKKTICSKLKTRYEHHDYFVQSSGCKGELVCFKYMVDYILKKLKKQGPATRESIIKAAAKIVKEEIREIEYNKEFYPSVDDIIDVGNWIPE